MEIENGFNLPTDKTAYVNKDEALNRIRGNVKIYKMILQSYTNKTFMEQLAAELDAGDFDAAAKTIHAIKGVVGNLSLPLVHEKSKALEMKIKDGSVNQQDRAEFEAIVEKTLYFIGVTLEELN